MKKLIYPLTLLILATVGLRLSVYTVDAAEYVYVTLLGEHRATYDGGAEATGAGLHFGWPWPAQAVQRLDRRLQQFDLPATELLTHDPEGKTIDKMLLVEAYVCWKIADRQAVDLFVRRIGTVERANAILEPRIRSELGAAIGQMRMDDLVSTDVVPGTGKTRVDVTVDGLHDRLLSALKKPVTDEYGIELVDIRLRRFSHPAQVRESIFDRIKSERNKKVTEYIEEGGRLAQHRVRGRREGPQYAGQGAPRRGEAEGRGRRRGDAHPQRGAPAGPGVLRVPQEDGKAAEYPRRQQNGAAAVHQPADVRIDVPAAAAAARAEEGAGAEEGRPVMRWLILGFAGFLILLITAVTALTQVEPGERAVVRRFGMVLADRPGPGLYRGLPWGMDRVDRVAVGKVRRISVGFTGAESEDPSGTPAGQLVTGDHNLVNVQAEIYYKVSEDQVDKFALQADRVEPVLARLTEAALAEWIAGRTVDDVLVRGKLELPAHVRDVVQERLRPYDLGVEVEQASIIRLYPPDEVKTAFDEVAKAQTKIRTQINQAEQEKERRLSEARAEVFHKQRQAAAYTQEQKLQAQAEAAAFLKQLAQYRTLAARDPDYLNTLWLDGMTAIYAKMKEAGRIDVLDHYLSKEGLSITQFPLLPKKK